MKVKVVKPVKFLHKGKFYLMNQEFDYDGEMNEYLALASKAEPATPAKAPVKAKVEEPVEHVHDVGEEVIVPDDVDVNESVTVLEDLDFANMSPEQIAAKIAEVEEPQIQEEVEAPKFSISNISRGWYNVIDAEGNELSPKNLRKDEAEALLATLE